MKEGRTVQDLAAEIQRQADSKRDFIAHARAMGVSVTHDGKTPELVVGNSGAFPIRETAHRQLAGVTGIPWPYYQRLRADAPHLLVQNANEWLNRSTAQHLVRTMDGDARAVLSNRYRPLDNVDLASAVLPVFAEAQINVVSCEVTESRLYFQAVSARVQGEVRKGDVVQAGVVVSNSEIGHGSLRVEPLVFRLVCLNGAIINEAAMRSRHLGRRTALGDDDFSQEFLSDETRAADDRALWLRVRDTVKGVLTQATFDMMVARMRVAAGAPIQNTDLPAVVEVVGKRLDLQEEEKRGVLYHLIQGGDLSQWGLANAVTRLANDVADYDRAVVLERAGGEVLELGPSEWAKVAA